MLDEVPLDIFFQDCLNILLNKNFITKHDKPFIFIYASHIFNIEILQFLIFI